MLAGQNYIIRWKGFMAIILLGFFAYAFVGVAAAAPAAGSTLEHQTHQAYIEHSPSGSATDNLPCQNNCAGHVMCSLCFGIPPSIKTSEKAPSAARFGVLLTSYHERFVLLDPPPPKNQLA